VSSILWPSWLPLRDDLRGLSPYGAPQVDVPVRLNTNENPHGPSAALVERIARDIAAIAGSLNRYPDRDATVLRTALARYIAEREGVDVAVDRVWAANGSNEILQQLLMACGGAGRTAVGYVPSYSMHELIATATGTRWVALRRAADFSVRIDADELGRWAPSIVFLTSPNNPTGTALDLDVIRALAVATADLHALLVVDEAYAEFARDPSQSALHLQAEFPHLVVSRTMSKAFALAGARIGYLVAHPSVVTALQLVRLPYHLSTVTQAVAVAALEHAGELLGSVDQVRAERDRIVVALTEMGLDVVPSDANFVLFGTFDDQKAIWSKLLEKGVLVRDVGLAGYLRVTAGTAEETDRFLSALAPLVSGVAPQIEPAVEEPS
jgi:histidinol-phosphate aminotransferase